jgi:hypothetical protein
MSKLARWIAPVALAGGLVAGLIAIPAAEASSAAAANITIGATSPNFPGLTAKDDGLVDGYALVIYKVATVDTAVISGTVTTTVTTDTAQLMAKPFGATTYTAVGSPLSLGTVGANDYSFNVTPSLATQYEVQVSGAAADEGTSAAVSVYVTVASVVKSSKITCTSARCVQTAKVATTVPKSAYKIESGKHVYLYLAIGKERGTKAVLPKDYTLSKASTASKAKRVNSGEFEETLKFVVPLTYGKKTVWLPNACSKDAVTKDGLGLPGHHGCGNKHIPTNSIYIG